MADVDAIAKLLEVGFNAVFLFLLWRVYQDFMSFIERHITYLERLTERLLPDEDEPPPAVRSYPPPVMPYSSRVPTELGERNERATERAGI